MEHLEAAEITRYMRGQLPPDQAQKVERHLATCAACAEKVAAESEHQTEVPAAEASYATGVDYPAASPGASPAASPEASPAASPVASSVVPPPQPITPRWILEGRTPERGEQVGRYLVLERVGQGGMGIVYAAWDPDLGRRVAIKLLRTDKQHAEGRTVGQARLLREAQAMARVSHPHVIPVFDVGTLGEGVFVAMEFVDGTTLKKWVKEKPRSWQEVLDKHLAAGRGLAGAHAVGLVHRDFKPDNVLIDKEGRVRVTDFGLARLAEEGAEPPRPALPEESLVHAAPELVQVTLDGHAVGTLMYMSPEQRRGEAPDARADQFSFCVALYWALFGVWPFDRQRSSARDGDYSPPSSHKGTSRPSQRTADPRPVNPNTGAFEPPRDSKVPAFVREAIMRGLSPDPQHRFPSMEALLSRLEYRPRRVRQLSAAAALLVTVAASGYSWHLHREAQHQAQLCTGAEQQLAGVWDDAVRGQVTAALKATGQANAADVASRVTGQLDSYARGWVEASTEACRATRIRGEQTEQLLSLRVVCLERRLQDVKAVAGVLGSADAALMERAVDTVFLLPSLKGCADVSSLSQVESPPDSPEAQAAIERISGQLAQLKALSDAGRGKQAQEVMGEVVKAADALGYRPLVAEARMLQGAVEAKHLNDVPAAEQHLIQAASAALASRSDTLLARAASLLVFALGYDPKRMDSALQWGELARGALARLGGNEELEAELLSHLGSAYTRARKSDEALAALQRALQLTEKALGKDHVRRASILQNLGNLYRRTGRYSEAVQATREALAVRERVNGPEHVLTGFIHYSLAQALIKTSELEQAQLHANRSLELTIVAFGADHPETATAYDLVGQVLLMRKQWREAREAYEKSLAIKEKHLGKEHLSLSFSSVGLAEAYTALGEPARALPLYQRTLTINTHDPFTRGDAFFGMAHALHALGRKRPEVLAAAQKAKEMYADAKDAKWMSEVDTWVAKLPGSTGGARASKRR